MGKQQSYILGLFMETQFSTYFVCLWLTAVYLSLLTNPLCLRCLEFWEMENPGALRISCKILALILGTGTLLQEEELLGFYPSRSCVAVDVIKRYHIVFHFVA